MDQLQKRGVDGVRRTINQRLKVVLVCCIVLYGLCVQASAQVTQRVSQSSTGSQGDQPTWARAITPDGRYVVIDGGAGSLVQNDSNGAPDVLLRDRRTGTIELINVDSNGVQANADSDHGDISADGRFVAFSSYATNLVPGDTNNKWDGYLRDRVLGTTERVSVSSAGSEANDNSYAACVTPDGRFVVLLSRATDLVPGGVYAGYQLYLRDCLAGTTESVSIAVGGGLPNNECYSPSVSADGRFVAFWSPASNLVIGDTNHRSDVFVYDRQSGTNERVDLGSQGAQANDGCHGPTAISADGRYIAFCSYATNLVPGDTNNVGDIFLRDRYRGITERVNLTSVGGEANGESGQFSISNDARFVVFVSYATNLVPVDSNGVADVFIRDRQLGITERVSVDSAGNQAGANDYPVVVSGHGRFVAFGSSSSGLVPDDTNNWPDAFIRDRIGGPLFVSLCAPGVDGVASCPCSNSPSGADRGCENSSSTGGALLSASGGTFLSSDSLVFQTSGERLSAMSILMQGKFVIAGGSVYGQGIQCVGGNVGRLYTKVALGGSITAPEFPLGDSQVSVRSAALGDTIHAGESRYYCVAYRDPIVLGGCPPSSTFNCTQTGRVDWGP